MTLVGMPYMKCLAPISILRLQCLTSPGSHDIRAQAYFNENGKLGTCPTFTVLLSGLDTVLQNQGNKVWKKVETPVPAIKLAV